MTAAVQPGRQEQTAARASRTRSLYRSSDLTPAADHGPGLSVWSVLPAALVATVVASALGSATGTPWVFRGVFIAVWLVAALAVRARRGGDVLLWTPLAFAGVALLGELRDLATGATKGTTNALKGLVYDRLILGAPALVAAVVLVGLVWLLRRRSV